MWIAAAGDRRHRRPAAVRHHVGGVLDPRHRVAEGARPARAADRLDRRRRHRPRRDAGARRGERSTRPAARPPSRQRSPTLSRAGARVLGGRPVRDRRGVGRRQHRDRHRHLRRPGGRAHRGRPGRSSSRPATRPPRPGLTVELRRRRGPGEGRPEPGRGDRHRRRRPRAGDHVRLAARGRAARWSPRSSASASGSMGVADRQRVHRHQQLDGDPGHDARDSPSASTTPCSSSPATATSSRRDTAVPRPPGARSAPPARRSSSPAQPSSSPWPRWSSSASPSSPPWVSPRPARSWSSVLIALTLLPALLGLLGDRVHGRGDDDDVAQRRAPEGRRALGAVRRTPPRAAAARRRGRARHPRDPGDRPAPGHALRRQR